MFDSVRHERELRDQWECLHLALHTGEGIARDKAEAAVNARLDGMNELRTQINNERGSYATRDYVDTVNSSTDGRLKALERKDSNTDGRFWVLGAVVILINLVMFFLGKR